MNRKLTDQQVIQSRSGIKSARRLSKDFGISVTNIEFIRSGKHYKEVKGYTTDKGFKPRNLNHRQVRLINYFLERGYLSYQQLARHFKVSIDTIYKLNVYDSRPRGRLRKYNQISYTYFKVLYDQLGSYQKVADKVETHQKNIYRLLTGYKI